MCFKPWGWINIIWEQEKGKMGALNMKLPTMKSEGFSKENKRSLMFWCIEQDNLYLATWRAFVLADFFYGCRRIRMRWVWVDSGSWWWRGRPGMLQFMGSQRVGQTEPLNWTDVYFMYTMGFPDSSVGKESSWNSVQFLGQEDLVEKGLAPHSGILGLSFWLSC